MLLHKRLKLEETFKRLGFALEKIYLAHLGESSVNMRKYVLLPSENVYIGPHTFTWTSSSGEVTC